MGIVIKNQPVGVDKTINNINTFMYEFLLNAGWTNYDAYHRGYKNYKNANEGFIPEIYTSESITQQDYKEAFLNDNLNASSFFLVDENTSPTGNLFVRNIDIFFQVNVRELYEPVTHRADEEARNDVIVSLKRNPYINEIINIDTGIDNVFSGFETSAIRWDDMQPYHIFKVTVSANANYDCDWLCQYTPESSGGLEYILDFGLN